jgi:hypothetical protein
VATQPEHTPEPDTTIEPDSESDSENGTEPDSTLESDQETDTAPPRRTIRIHGMVPPELWNRLGTKLLPKLRSGEDLKVGIDMSTNMDASTAESLLSDLRQILQDLELTDQIHLDDQ